MATIWGDERDCIRPSSGKYIGQFCSTWSFPPSSCSIWSWSFQSWSSRRWASSEALLLCPPSEQTSPAWPPSAPGQAACSGQTCQFCKEEKKRESKGRRMIVKICRKTNPGTGAEITQQRRVARLKNKTASDRSQVICCWLLWRLSEESPSCLLKWQPLSRSSIKLKWLFSSSLWLLH